MAANEKWLAEQRVRIKARNERIASEFAELRKTYSWRSNDSLFHIVANREGVSSSTVRDVVIKAGLVKTGTIKIMD